MKKNVSKENKNTELQINVIPILKELLKRLWLIVLVGLVVGGAVFAGAKLFIRPTYRSGFTAYVNNKQSKQSTDSLTNSDVVASKQIVLTYQNILTSNTILTAAAQSVNIDVSYATLRRLVFTEIKDETEIISVYVVYTDPRVAYEYAQAISKISPQYMSQIVEGSSMKIIDYPEYSEVKYKPSYLQFGIIGFLIGALIVMVLVIIRFFMDDTVKSESEIENGFAFPILGVIPDITKASDKKSDYYYYEKDAKTEQVDISEGEPKNEEKEK